MEIIVLAIITVLFFIMAALNKQHKLLGLVAGIGLVMLALGVQTTGIQIQTGVNQTVYTDTNSSQTIFLYTDLVNMGSGLSALQIALVIILGAAGLLILLNSVSTVKL